MAKCKEISPRGYHHLEVRINKYLQAQCISLTPKERQLLSYLLQHANTVVTRNVLLTHVWGYSCAGHSRTVDVHIQHLRKKLHGGNCIQTVFKAGYRLDLSALLSFLASQNLP